MSNFTQLSEGDGTIFLVRWRGRQEGPYPGPVIAAKLAANEIGLLHEVYYESKWVTLRDYIAIREAALAAETQARQNAEQKLREEGELRAKEKEGRQRAEILAEERRKNDLLAAEIVRQSDTVKALAARQTALSPHRGGQILALGLIGFFIFGPLCVAAWIMGSGDLRAMDAGLRDDRGRATTSIGRTIGAVGIVLWIAGAIIFLLSRAS